MKLNKCTICGSTSIKSITDTLETVINDKTLVIENIEAEKCVSCGEIYYSSMADEYIENQIEKFKDASK